MELIYSAEWIDHPEGSSTLTIGCYTAHVYRYPNGSEFRWWVRYVEPNAEDEAGDYEIDRARDDSSAGAREAVEETIRAHHATLDS